MSEETNATESSVKEPAVTAADTQKKVVKKPSLDPKNDPYRFKGEGVVFNAKLIGASDVPEARGDRMCQETILAQKMAVKTSGQHKQRIIINISEEGIKLIDLRTATLLHHHPVHKISFISRDVSDRRAFGYIYGTEEKTHKFFGIKTEKAAENVVLALRDLFQVVYENKKKEMEAAKKQQTEPTDTATKEETPQTVVKLGGDLTAESSTDDEPTSKETLNEDEIDEPIYEVPPNNGPVEKEPTDLFALQTEIVSIEQGIKQINKMESLFDDFSAPPTSAPATSSASSTTSSDPWGSSTENTTSNKSASSDLDELNLFSNEPAPVKKKDDIMSLFGPGGQPGFGGPQPQQMFGGPQPGMVAPQPGYGAPQPGMGGPQGFGGPQPQQGFGAFGQPATPFPPTSQPNPFGAQQGIGFGGLAPPPVPQRQQSTPNPFGGQQQPAAAPQQQNFSLFDEPVLAPMKVEDPFAAPAKSAPEKKDAFADLCSIGTATTAKSPKDLFAARNAPPKKSINDMMGKTPDTGPQQASDPFGNVDDTSLPAAVDFSSPFTCKSSDPFDTSFLKSSPAVNIQPTSALNVSASSNCTEELTLNQNCFENSEDFDLPSPQGPPPPLPNDPPPPAPPPRPVSSHNGHSVSSMPLPPSRISENVPKTVSPSCNSQTINGNTPVPRPRPRTNITPSLPPRNNVNAQEAPPTEQSTKNSHSDSFSSFTIEDPFATNDPFADADPFSSEGFGSSGFDSLNSSDPFASFSSPMKDGSSTKNGDFVSDSRNDPFAVFDSSFGDSFNFKGGSLKKKGHRKSSGGKPMPAADPNDPFGFLVASKPVQNGS